MKITWLQSQLDRFIVPFNANIGLDLATKTDRTITANKRHRVVENKRMRILDWDEIEK